MTRGVSLLLVLAFASAAAGCGGLDKGAYVRKNEQILRALPVYPGAHPVRVTSIAYRDDRGLDEPAGPVVGYRTRIVYALPGASSTQEVVAFYRTRLRPRWRLVASFDGPVLEFRRGQAGLDVNLESHRSHVLDVGVDHAWYAKRRPSN